MKMGTKSSSVVFRPIRRSRAASVCLAFVIGVIAFSALYAHAGNIFDDDWTPPKRAAQPHTAPAQTPPVVPIPTATAPSQPAPASQTPSRRAIPEKPDLARSRGLLKEAFAKQLKDRSPAGRKKLAQALLDEVPKAADNPTDQYVLLGGAIEASKDAAVLPLCFQAADMMATQYEVDGLNVKAEAALKMNLRGDSPATAAENVKAAMELIDPLLDGEDFSTATKILALARPAVTGDPSLASIVQKRMQVVEALRTAHDRFAQRLQKLKAAPDDPAANLAVGNYLCFNKGEWDKGLPMLVKGSDPNLKQLAEIDVARPTSTEDVMRLGDRWWDFGAKQPDAIRREICKHAISFYKTALESATGLRRTLIERRIAEASEPASASSSHGGPDNFTNSIGMKFVRIKPGEFLMGSPPEEVGRQDNETLHRVKMTRPFLMATTTVTQAQWKAVMGKNPSHFQGDNRPVETVSWNDAVAFCEKLSAKDGKRYRLPTEAEWEYACRAGTQTSFSFGDANIDDFAWYDANSAKQTHDVGTKKPNAWGLYDMNGNVWQWCSDGYGPYGGDTVDPKGADDMSMRVTRGGSWIYGPKQLCRAACRRGFAPINRIYDVAFRVCLDF